LENLPVPSLESEQAVCQFRCVNGLNTHAFEEVLEPRVPIAVRRHPQEEVVVRGACPLEEGGEVEQGLGKQTPLCEEEKREEAPNPSVPVAEGVDRLELIVDDGRLDERPQPVLVESLALLDGDGLREVPRLVDV